MKDLRDIANFAIVLAILSIFTGVLSRLMVVPVPIANGIEAQSFLDFANTCLLFAIALLVLGLAKQK